MVLGEVLHYHVCAELCAEEAQTTDGSNRLLHQGVRCLPAALVPAVRRATARTEILRGSHASRTVPTCAPWLLRRQAISRKRTRRSARMRARILGNVLHGSAADEAGRGLLPQAQGEDA